MWCDVWGEKRGGCPSYMLRTLKWIPWMDEEVDEFLIEGKLILEISLFPFSVLKQQRGVEIFIVCFYHCICTYDWLVDQSGWLEKREDWYRGRWLTFNACVFDLLRAHALARNPLLCIFIVKSSQVSRLRIELSNYFAAPFEFLISITR